MIKRPYVLIVDDEDFVRTDIRKTLTRKKCTVDEASGYKEALQKIEDNNYDVVVVDIKMANKNGRISRNAGMDLLEEIKKRNIDISIFMLTGFASLYTLERAEELGISSYLDKASVSPRYKSLGDKVFHEVKKAFIKKIPIEEVSGITSKDPFEISYNDYLKLILMK